ncbi:hypothetical protein J3R82DRAFT_1231 [Butyriboletus roseoflavus]|nr:hypothetical protein J3R82DRAFT_1231 [Butyriboletus roseoflavus]
MLIPYGTTEMVEDNTQNWKVLATIEINKQIIYSINTSTSSARRRDGMSEQESLAREGNLRKLAIRVSIRHSSLRFSAHERFPQEARRDGVFAGLTSGLTAGKIMISDPRLMVAEILKCPASRRPALLGSRFMGFNKNKTVFCGLRE